MLKEYEKLWGIPLETIKQLGKKYKKYSFIVYTCNFIIMILCGVYMFNNNSSFSTCVFATISISLLSFLSLSLFINPEKWRAYLFYKKYKNLEVREYTLYLDEDNMKSILYCANYKRKKENGSMSDYAEFFLSACCEDSIYSKRLGTLLSRFANKDNTKNQLVVYMLNKGKKYFLIDIKNEQ